ncbi:hypothetical protein P7K49_016182 [Saguinus oedipus]|uniref:Uncharacterized protein n=1 Tax=Saguinus oedipus TaxID=9490 RepID=A0ABQ9VBB3_SAGOE|nr:hypothetical protein P7K49_016182 [Saguinus oedipus]
MAALILRGVRELLKRVDFATVPRRHRHKKKWRPPVPSWVSAALQERIQPLPQPRAASGDRERLQRPPCPYCRPFPKRRQKVQRILSSSGISLLLQRTFFLPPW